MVINIIRHEKSYFGNAEQITDSPNWYADLDVTSILCNIKAAEAVSDDFGWDAGVGWEIVDNCDVDFVDGH